MTDLYTDEHVLSVAGYQGDLRSTWDPKNQDEVDSAKATFDRLKKQGYTAHKVKKDGSEGEIIREFDPEAGKIIMMKPMAGG